MISGTLRIGTRGSALALAQAGWVKERIEKCHPGMGVSLVVIKTKGDIMQDVALVKIGGKGVFVKEIEDALLRRDIDLAVHSLKDVPAELPPGLTIAVTPEREDPRDVFVSKHRIKFEAMPRRARIGTGSLRRGFQIRNIFPDVEIVPLRGNLDTRLKKVETEDLDAVVVAAAGIRRLGWVSRVTQFLPVETIIPAVGQGTLAIEVREDDATVRRPWPSSTTPRRGGRPLRNGPFSGASAGDASSRSRPTPKRRGRRSRSPASWGRSTGGS